MSDNQIEEMAALQALGLLDEAGLKTLLTAARRDEEVAGMVDSFEQTASWLAYDAPQVAPPPALRRELLRQLPAHRETAKTIPFLQWVPYAVAACLMALVYYQWAQIFSLKAQVHTARVQLAGLRKTSDLNELRLAQLEAKDAAYSSARVMVAWDPRLHRGIISMRNLPAPPPGKDYQLWVLDPSAPAPISAGLLVASSVSQNFGTKAAAANGPGFAISLEPAGGRPLPTGAILFAVAPGQ
jgi:anti-sigma-K factor RskA